MKINRILISSLFLIQFSLNSFTQDIRTLETKVADLLAAMPAATGMTADKLHLLKPVLKYGLPAVKKSAIELLAWSRETEYFSEILDIAASSNDTVKRAAYAALKDLGSEQDQPMLIKLLTETTDPQLIKNIQAALTNAAMKIPDEEKRSDIILAAIAGGAPKEKLIPVLSKTGGRKALKTVLDEFENGNPEMREICFKTLTDWKDYSASAALYEICISGNKSYEAPAFDGYVKQVRETEMITLKCQQQQQNLQ